MVITTQKTKYRSPLGEQYINEREFRAYRKNAKL